MANYKRECYNISLAGQGYVFARYGKNIPRQMSKATAYGVTPTTDVEYKDASAFFPWVQTDWSGGFQAEKWKDDARFKTGSGLEYIAQYGELTLLNDKSVVKTIGDNYTFGASLIYNKTLLIGTKHATLATLGYLNSSDEWTDVTTGWVNINQVNDMDELGGKAYLALKRTGGSEKCLQSYDGSTLADATGDAANSDEWRMVKRIETRLYASNLNSTANGDRLIYSDNNGTNWSTIITATGKNRSITKGVVCEGTLYFLIEDFPRVELWWCNDTLITQIYRWENLTNPDIAVWLGNVYIQGKEDGKLRRFVWNGATLKVVFEEKLPSLDLDSGPMVVYKNNLHSYGLVYDGVYNFPSWTFKYSSNKIYPFNVFGSSTSQVPYFYGLDGQNLKITKLNTSAYLTSGSVTTPPYNGDKAAVSKLWHSITLTFKKLASGQSIKVEYSTDDEATWTTVGTATYASTGNGANTEITFYFPSNVISKRIQLKITLGGEGSNTPTLYEFLVRFLNLPDDKMSWSLILNCSDKILLLDGHTEESKRGSELRNILLNKKYNKEIVEFQDVDYAETAINATGGISETATTIPVDSTADFPEQGRLRIEQEEILYTGKTATAFTGCTRGVRGTSKAAHADNKTVSNSYNVIIVDYKEINPMAVQSKTEETYAIINLFEI